MAQGEDEEVIHVVNDNSCNIYNEVFLNVSGKILIMLRSLLLFSTGAAEASFSNGSGKSTSNFDSSIIFRDSIFSALLAISLMILWHRYVPILVAIRFTKKRCH